MLAAAPSLAAQATHDAPRSFIGFSIGEISGGNLWDIAAQPITPISTPVDPGNHYAPDVDHLTRDLAPRRPAFSIHGARFFNAHVGFTAEFTYLAAETRDGCTVVQPGVSRDPLLAAVCDSVPATSQGGRAIQLWQGGLIVRPLANSLVQPYLVGMAGIALTPSSTAALQSIYGHDASANPIYVNIYQDPGWSNARPTGTLAAGLATAATGGLQVHIEARDSWIAQSIVTGPTTGQAEGQVTPVAARYRGWVSVFFGFDLVLGRQRGRRY